MRTALAFAAALALSGCPYEAAVPLGDAKAIDARVAGLWSWTSPTSGYAVQLRVVPFSATEYFVEFQERKTHGSETETNTARYRAWPVTVAGETLVNITQLEEKPPAKVMFARYKLVDEDTLSIRFVGEKAIPGKLGSDRAALAAFVSERLASGALDDPDAPLLLHRRLR